MPMKKIYGMYVVLLLLAGGGNMAGAQVYSTQVFYSPSYMAMGGGELFYQDISGGYVISQSCMPITQSKAYLKSSPVIVPFFDAVNRYTNTKNTVLLTEDARLKKGSLSCMIY